MQYEFVTLDVFTDRMFGGNPLAVLPDARGLGTEQMQAIAREFNYSETTFVLPPTDPARKTILFVGRLDRRKGLAVLLRAMPRVLGKVSSRLVVVGGGPGEPAARRLVDELGIEDAVTFAGRVPRYHAERFLFFFFTPLREPHLLPIHLERLLERAQVRHRLGEIERSARSSNFSSTWW